MAEIADKLDRVVYLSPMNTGFHFILIGIGGTGSELAGRLCRYLASLRESSPGAFRHDVSFCDADVVEEKNLMRQNFFFSDIGENKAEVMAMKCATLFDMEIKAFTEYVESTATLDKIISTSAKNPFVIGCVDNNATRKVIIEYASQLPRGGRLVYLDAGNETFSGQVSLGYYGCRSLFKPHIVRDNGISFYGEFRIPGVDFHHPEMLESDDKFASELSCAERAISAPQAMTANVEAANILFQMICNILNGRIDYHYVAFDTLTSVRAVRFNTTSALKAFGLKQVDRSLDTLEEDIRRARDSDDDEGYDDEYDEDDDYDEYDEDDDYDEYDNNTQDTGPFDDYDEDNNTQDTGPFDEIAEAPTAPAEGYNYGNTPAPRMTTNIAFNFEDFDSALSRDDHTPRAVYDPAPSVGRTLIDAILGDDNDDTTPTRRRRPLTESRRWATTAVIPPFHPLLSQPTPQLQPIIAGEAAATMVEVREMREILQHAVPDNSDDTSSFDGR